MVSANVFAAEVLRQDALLEAKSQPICVSQVEVNGGSNFSTEFFSKLLAPLTSLGDYTLELLLERVDECDANLRKTAVFRSVKPSLHVDFLHPLPQKTSYNKDKPILTRVVFDLEADERSAGNLLLGFNSEENLVLDVGYLNNNFNHNAELVTIGVNYIPYKPYEHLVSGARVESSLRNPSFKFVLDLFNSHQNNQAWQQNSSSAVGGAIGVLYLNNANTLSVYNGLALSRRSVYDFEDGAADALKIFSGDYLKSSIVSRVAYRNYALRATMPLDGVCAAVSNEVVSDQEQAAQTQNFSIKTAATLNLYKSFYGSTLTTHLFNELGNIYAPGGVNSVHLADRFYLGGFNSFRGFARNGVNENGGLRYFKAGATLYSKFPAFFRRSPALEVNPLRLYLTGMVGNVASEALFDSGAASAGVGLRYFDRWVKMDMGYFVSRRLSSSSDYGVRDGFKLEVSVGGGN